MQQCLLDQVIYDTGDAQLVGSAFGFGDFDGAYTLRMILIDQQPSLEDRPILFYIACKLIDRHAIGTRGALVADHTVKARFWLPGLSPSAISVSGSAFVQVTDAADVCALSAVILGYRPGLGETVFSRRIFCV